MLGLTTSSTNRVVRETRDWLAAQVPADELPLEPLGCGHYGCVYSTGREDVVVKVTTDPAEVFFVQTAMTFDHWPDGIVRYDRIMAVPDRSYRNRPFFYIWREAAFDVGTILTFNTSVYYQKTINYDERTQIIAWQRLNDFKAYAHEARTVLTRAKDPSKVMCEAKRYAEWAWDQAMEVDMEQMGMRARGIRPHRYGFERFKSGMRVAYCLAMCKAVAQYMENEPLLYSVGDALAYYFDKGILMADVHAGNIGRVDREGDVYVVITDPGHALDLRPYLAC